MLATGASLSALREVCALPEGSAAWAKSGCPGPRAKGRARHRLCRAEPRLRAGQPNRPAAGNRTSRFPPIAEDNRPAWLIDTGDKVGKKALDDLVTAAVAADRCVRLARRYAFNYSNGDPAELVAAVVEPAGCPSAKPPPTLRDAPDRRRRRTGAGPVALPCRLIRTRAGSPQRESPSAFQRRREMGLSTANLERWIGF